MSGPMQFRIRDVLWGMTLLAIALGWWLDHRMLHARNVRMISALERDFRGAPLTRQQIDDLHQVVDRLPVKELRPGMWK
jgi:hypothetical protein